MEINIKSGRDLTGAWRAPSGPEVQDAIGLLETRARQLTSEKF